MSFESPGLVRRCVRRIEENDIQRQEQRSWINRLFNGDPPYTRAEADAEGIEWNYNNKQAAKLAHDARGRFNTAHLSTKVYFNCKLDSGPAYKRTEWETLVTNTVGKIMKRSLEFETSEREVFAQVALHGPGPAMWPDKFTWKCESVGLQNLKVPSLTFVNLKNLQYFSIVKEYTPGELYKKIQGPKIDQGWKVPLVKKCIMRAIEKTDAGESYDNGMSTYSLNPEKFWEEVRANLGFWCSDAAQVIRCYDFYFQDAKSSKWQRRIVLADQSEIDDHNDGAFLYKPRRDYADELGEFFHCQFADYNNVAPFYFDSVRGLGWLLYDLCFAQNRLDCKMTESAFLQLMMLFIASDPQDRDRLDKLMLHDMGVIPDGLRIVPNTERHSPNQQIVQGAFANLQNSINQNASSFTNDAALGSNDKEQTLGEWTGKLSIYNQMVSATLDLSYRYQAHKYREILRRFFIKDSPDKDVQEFQETVIKRGLPKQYLDIKRWEVIPERVMGGGNRTLAVQEAQAVFASRFAYSPRGQQIAAHDLVMALTNDPSKANELVDLSEAPTNNTVKYTESLFGTIMEGIMPKADDISDHISVIETMLGMMNAVIQPYAQVGMMPPDKIGGLKTAIGYTEQHRALLEQDKNEKARAKQYGDELKNIANQVKAFEQRAMQQAQAQQGGDMNGDAQKLQIEQARGQQKLQLDQQKAAQKMSQKNQQFAADQKRRDLQTAADIADQQTRTEAEIAQDNVTAVHDIRRNTVEEVAKTTEMT